MRHHHEAGIAERGAGGLGDRGLAVADDLVDGERPEDAERDEDVEAAGDPERACTSRGAGRARGRARSPAEKVITLNPRNAKNVSATLATMSENGGIAAERQQAPVGVGDRHGDEDREDAELDDDDHRLRAVDDARPDEVDAERADDDEPW